MYSASVVLSCKQINYIWHDQMKLAVVSPMSAREENKDVIKHRQMVKGHMVILLISLASVAVGRQHSWCDNESVYSQ